MDDPHFDNPQWLSKKFVGNAMRDISHDPSVVVKDIAFTNVGGKRGKFGSDFFRVTVQYKSATQPHLEQLFIVKSLSSDKVAREFLVKWKYFEKEINMYEVTLPAMYAMVPPLKVRNEPAPDPNYLSPHCARNTLHRVVHCHQVTLPAMYAMVPPLKVRNEPAPDPNYLSPHCARNTLHRVVHCHQVTLPAMYAMVPPLKVRNEPAPDPNYLSPRCFRTARANTVILEDMRPQGFALCTKKLGLDHTHTKIALTDLAKFHALSLALYKKDPASMALYEEKFFVDSNREQIRQLVEQPFIDLPNEVATWPGYEHFAAKLRAVPVIDRVIEAMKTKPGALSVLNHGDFWTSNMMFKYVKGEPVAVKFVDFQQCRFASPALDIIFFMFSSPSEVVRDSFWDNLLDVYHGTFVETLKLANCDPNLLTVQQLFSDIQDKMYFGLLVACTMLPLTLAALESADLEGVEIYSTPRFKHAFQKLLKFFEKRSIL